ncbi:MAG: ATP-dependent Clp protease proteolytic subunit [Clostridia bacterium]|nr:ATP-dependent Clp protease proteolytic subunit [Clostridia bacterium]
MANFTKIQSQYDNDCNNLISAFFATNKNSDPNYINQEINKIRATTISKLRTTYVSELSKYTGRNTIVYYSTFLQGNMMSTNPELMINDNDMNGLMNAVSGLDKKKGLDLILHTPGGITTATEAIVKYLRKCFNSDIRVIVPHLAMSAGTMIACSAKEIIMGKESSLGPIDPQYRNVPAEGVIDEFNRAVKEIQAAPQKALVWKEIISQYRPTFLGECQYAIDLSRNLVTEWLSTCMFKSNKKREAKVGCIVNGLASHSSSKMHDKHYDFEDCKKIGLKVIALEKDSNLQDLVLSIHHSYVLSSYVLPGTLKYIENNNVQTFVISGNK